MAAAGGKAANTLPSTTAGRQPFKASVVPSQCNPGGTEALRLTRAALFNDSAVLGSLSPDGRTLSAILLHIPSASRSPAPRACALVDGRKSQAPGQASLRA